MKDYLLKLHCQIPEALAIGLGLRFQKSFARVKQVLFYGMGGSGISGDILRVLVTERSRDFFVVEHGGRWPQWAGPETLAVFSSYSGNTPEVLTHLPDAIAAQSQILIVTSGGRLGQMASQRKIPCLNIPAGMPPRCAIGYLTFSVLPVLEKAGKFRVPEKEISETLSLIRRFPEAAAKVIARKIFGKSVHLYAQSGLLDPVVVRWRAQLAENAKTLASHHFLPEIFHNEIEGWKFPERVIKNSTALFLTDKSDLPVLARKRKFAENYIRRQGGEVLNIASKGRSSLARLFSLISLGDWVSYELALLNKVDPLSIATIEGIKKVR
jgi:glucose/mannose-6-phosphate isomerase